MDRPIHPDFLVLLDFKPAEIKKLFTDARNFILEQCPGCTELLYHTHALTAVFSMSEKLGDAFCMLPIYNSHVNLGFNKGSLLPDPAGILTGTGNLIRHVDIKISKDYRNQKVKALLHAAIELAKKDMNKAPKLDGKTISKIKS